MATQTKLITCDDYLSLPDDGKRYEIIGGELFVKESPICFHQIISINLATELHTYVSKRNLGRILTAPMDIVLSMTDVVQPDLMFISNERSHIITENNIVAAPDLVVEIISESTKTIDQTSKKTLYKKYGVKEYWIVYPDDKKIEKFVLQGETFELKSEIAESEKLSSEVIEGFLLQLNNVFSNG